MAVRPRRGRPGPPDRDRRGQAALARCVPGSAGENKPSGGRRAPPGTAAGPHSPLRVQREAEEGDAGAGAGARARARRAVRCGTAVGHFGPRALAQRPASKCTRANASRGARRSLDPRLKPSRYLREGIMPRARGWRPRRCCCYFILLLLLLLLHQEEQPIWSGNGLPPQQGPRKAAAAPAPIPRTRPGRAEQRRPHRRLQHRPRAPRGPYKHAGAERLDPQAALPFQFPLHHEAPRIPPPPPLARARAHVTQAGAHLSFVVIGEARDEPVPRSAPSDGLRPPGSVRPPLPE
ncbi:hypothetical protein AOLI_G00232070 [Acnodon oligacanthus]